MLHMGPKRAKLRVTNSGREGQFLGCEDHMQRSCGGAWRGTGWGGWVFEEQSWQNQEGGTGWSLEWAGLRLAGFIKEFALSV